MSFVKSVEPLKGDLIRVQRKLGYFHFGIYIGKGKVIHFSANKDDSIFDNTHISISEAKLEDFLRGDILEVNLPFNALYSRREVVKRAKKMLGSKLLEGNVYDLLGNNCEHFANYCYYGYLISDQSVAANKGAVGVVSRLGVSIFNNIIKRRNNSIAKKQTKTEENDKKEGKK